MVVIPAELSLKLSVNLYYLLYSVRRKTLVFKPLGSTVLSKLRS